MWSSLTNKYTYINLKTHIEIYIKIHINIAPTCFGSLTIARELALNLAKVIFLLKHLVKLRHYYAVV